MKLEHLGDALDHWKGSLIALMGYKNLRIVPLLTDQEQWSPEYFNVYAKLLHRKTRDILQKHMPFSNKTRDSYFDDLGEGDLFVDPDTGIGRDEKRKAEHITPTEIASLLPRSSSRMLLIYQHSSRKKDGIKEKLKSLVSIDSLRGCHLFAYDAGAVSMILISRNWQRVNEALARPRSSLGPVASADDQKQLPGRIIGPWTVKTTRRIA